MKLISKTGVGWDSELGTISATNEWWKAKIQVKFHYVIYLIFFFMFLNILSQNICMNFVFMQECKGARKFRLVGIEPALKLKFDKNVFQHRGYQRVCVGFFSIVRIFL